MQVYFLLFKTIVYTFLMLLLGMAAYILFWFVLRPYKKRRYFKRFSKDVGLSPNFIPLLGDFKHLNDRYIKQGKFVGHFLRDLASKEYGKKKSFFA